MVYLLGPRAVTHVSSGNFKYKKITEQTTTNQFLRYHFLMQEMGARAIGNQTIALGRRVDKLTCIFNAFKKEEDCSYWSECNVFN
jgi:hypothetical protein